MRNRKGEEGERKTTENNIRLVFVSLCAAEKEKGEHVPRERERERDEEGIS